MVMEWRGSFEIYIFLVCAAVVSLIWSRKAFGRSGSLLPPGPTALPIIGHLHLLGDRPHQSLCELSKSYGPLMCLRLGGVRTIVASSPDMAKEILQTHDLAFAYRPRMAAAVHMCFDCTDIAFAPHGPYWKFIRQLCDLELFSTKRLEALRPIRVEEVRALILSLVEMGAGGQTPVKLRPMLLAASNNINCRMATGERIAELSTALRATKHPNHDLLGLIDELLYLVGVFCVGDFIPVLGWLDLHGYVKRMKAVGQRVSTIMQEVIDRRREARKGVDNSSPSDLLDLLLTASESNDPKIQISDDNIKAVILDLFAGGSDTVSVTVEWALAELINNPKAMKKVQEELDCVVGKARHVEEGDTLSLPYLRAVVKETMRLHPPAPLLLPHESTQQCQIARYVIPTKTRAYVNIWAIGRGPATWKSPLDFWPERFIDSSLDMRGHHFQLLPFGSGRRRCPGWALGLLNVHLMLATLLQSFTWSLPSSSGNGFHVDHVDMSERFGLTVTMEKPLMCWPYQGYLHTFTRNYDSTLYRINNLEFSPTKDLQRRCLLKALSHSLINIEINKKCLIITL